MEDIIIAPATAVGTSAIAIIRLSGKGCISIVNKIFKGQDLNTALSHTITFGTIVNTNNEIIDEVLVSIFKEGKSFTYEESIEISCHGSNFIVDQTMQLLIEKGARMAKPGEFTQRAFMNGRFDLTQAEAVADLIHSSSASSHKMAINQMRGSISSRIHNCRKNLIDIASLMTLELDFSEEDVEFVERSKIELFVNDTLSEIKNLTDNFRIGNAIKNGVPTVIIGKPNAGKSTLMNVLFNEEKSIVDSSPGTTRDSIEDQLVINGILFRVVDTAGIRDKTNNKVEAIGIEKAKDKMKKASIILYIFDLATESKNEIQNAINEIKKLDIPVIAIANKVDLEPNKLKDYLAQEKILRISACSRKNIDMLKSQMLEITRIEKTINTNTTIVNARHYECLEKSKFSLEKLLIGIKSKVSSEFLIQDLNIALKYLGNITGEVTNEDILGNLFAKFCIGK